MLSGFRHKFLAFLSGTCVDCKAIEGHNWHNCERCRKFLWALRK
jgi:hypothetical protein